MAVVETKVTRSSKHNGIYGQAPKLGAPVQSKTDGIWGVPPRGIALLVRKKWLAKMAQLDPKCMLTEEPWEPSRRQHSMAPPAEGKHPLNIMVVHGIARDSLRV